MTQPIRIQLSRRKGWRMPPNTVKVDRSTKWGNPFIVGTDGTRARCVELFQLMLGGWICLSRAPELPDAQIAYLKMAKRDRRHLKGKNLACWCPLDQPCHADVLLELANK
ncbi:MAG TPA: DUF4326 domain-containing protein [Xanthobacteraceae bacterium]|nr:DUF4326 domain-containing protein [Xanthobacteraceae bacterium]